MLCPMCKAEEAHPLYQVGGVYVCESCWCDSHSLLPSSVGHSIAYTKIPRRRKRDSDDAGYTAIEKAVYGR